MELVHTVSTGNGGMDKSVKVQSRCAQEQKWILRCRDRMTSIDTAKRWRIEKEGGGK